jgi:peptidoglycan/LPS O-acetylase OafA/YrhL
VSQPTTARHRQGSTAPRGTTTRARRYRTDIQGLRAIAVGAVVLYHLWPHRLQGGFIGVDVFFVISGFLITSHLVSKPPKTLRDFGGFWANRIRRLLPASLLVILVTVLAVWRLSPPTTWHDSGTQAVSAATYWQNWKLAFSSVDYLAADNAPTALQHFWSLSVEEQFYFVWPLFLALIIALGAAFRRSTAVLSVALAVVVVAGLGWSIWYTHDNPAMAYFVTTTRMWELAAGGLTAVLVMGREAGRGVLSTVVAWIGVAGIVVACFTLDPTAPFPGWRAAVPVFAAALVIGAQAEGRWSPNALLSLKPMQFIGNTSYSIYLWHWPLLIVAPALVGTLTWPVKLVLVALSVILAWLTWLLIEQRLRRRINRFSLPKVFAAAALAMAVVVVSGWGLTKAADIHQAKSDDSLAAAQKDPDACVGAAALEPGAAKKKACNQDGKLLLDPAAAKTDKSDAYKDGCWSNQPFDKRPTCTYGHGKTKVALVGNSHAGHWLPALQQLAKKRDWTITTYLISRCSVNEYPQTFDRPGQAQKCVDYGKWVKEQTTNGSVDAVITSERQSVRSEGASWKETESLSRKGYVPLLKAWHQAKVPVVVLRDVPFPGASDTKNVPDCLAQNNNEASKCDGTLSSWYWMDPLVDAVQQEKYSDQHVIQTSQWVCPDGRCQPIIGGVVTYFDDSHLTATYAQTLAPALARELDELKISDL